MDFFYLSDKMKEKELFSMADILYENPYIEIAKECMGLALVQEQQKRRLMSQGKEV